jgi:hypothetical protein
MLVLINSIEAHVCRHTEHDGDQYLLHQPSRLCVLESMQLLSKNNELVATFVCTSCSSFYSLCHAQ